MSFVNNSDKCNFKNAKIHLNTFKNLRRSYSFILKLF
jgi:hypothetical protein